MYDMIVVATYAEATASFGARYRRGEWIDNAGNIFVSVAAGPRAIDGMKVRSWRITSRAADHPGADKLIASLERSVRKFSAP